MAYSFLQSAVEFCDQSRIDETMKKKSEELADKRHSHLLPRVEELKNILPPSLDFSTDINTIGQEWWAERDRQQEHCRVARNEQPCVMAWTAGPEVSVQFEFLISLSLPTRRSFSPLSFAHSRFKQGPTSNAQKLRMHLKPFLLAQGGWKFEQDMSHGWARRLGIVPRQNGDTIEFLFRSVAIPLRTLTLQSIKSYGEAWQGSQMEVEVLQRSNSTEWTTVDSINVTGIHNSTSSITYNTEMLFPETVEPGNDVRVKCTLTGGTSFKISGMMLCSR